MKGITKSGYSSWMAKNQPESNPACQQWFNEQPAMHREWLMALRQQIVSSVPAAEESLKWSRPCYARDGALFCYLASAKKYVTIGFHRGADLPDPSGVLEGTGKAMRHVKVHGPEDAVDASITKLICAAYRLTD